jgi:DNA-binding response OmpR family regulator
MARILVIDDDAEIRRMIKIILEKAGHVAFVADDGNEALTLSRQNLVDLVITDILMPLRDGLDVILDIRSNRRDTKIIAMSGGGPGMSSDGCLILASDLGADAVLQKPISKSELLTTIKQLLPQEGLP